MYSLQDENLRLDRANRALALIEQLEMIAQSLAVLVDLVPSDLKTEVRAILARAEGLYAALNETEEGAAVVELSTSLADSAKTKIERLCLGSEIIQMRRNGSTYQEIGRALDITPTSVSRFCRAYDLATPAKKAELRKKSIFDTAQNMEDLAAALYRQLAKLEATDPEHHVKYVSEMRQLIISAQKFMEQLSTKQKIDNISQLVMEILLQELPERRGEILKRFSDIGFRGMLQSAQA